MKIAAIIPARGGSKGIPDKNIKILSGQPLISYTIENAKRSGLIERVFVSTDSLEIERISKAYGAEVILRPPEISGDRSSSEEALLDALKQIEEKNSLVPDILVFLQCTSPLTLPEDINGTIQVLLDEKADSAFSAAHFHYFLWKREPDGDSAGINHNKKVRPLRQEREAQFLETGAVYAMRANGFKEAKFRFFGKTAMYVMPAERCLEIDEPFDLVLAESRLLDRKANNNIQKLPDRIEAAIFDFDGVFTDNSVIIDENGVESALCNRSDGHGISLLKVAGVPILTLSTEKKPIVLFRSQKLGVECINGVDNKLAAMTAWAAERGIDLSKVVYVGNDVNDLECLRAVGCGVAVADAYPEIKSSARIVLRSSGGRGAVREICDLLIQKIKAV